MDEFLKEHIFVKFLLCFLLGGGIFLYSYKIFKNYKKESLESPKDDYLKIYVYYRSIIAMCVAIIFMIFSFYMLFDDLTTPKEDNINKKNVEVQE